MQMSDLMSPFVTTDDDASRVARLLLDHGVDLAATAAPAQLDRGTPVYVHSSADPVDVQRRMVQAHVRMLFVIEAGSIAGIVDLREITKRAEALSWPGGPSASRSTN